ncbi:MAG TPA: hypothetical protein VMM38_01460 [Aridibacter sp.]|nr:hypothetical protein [Aridibacter sp.]
MQDPNSAMTQAFDGMVKEVAIEIGVTDKRLYELLGRDNPYPKLWRMLNPLGRLNFPRLQLVQGDFNARVARLAPRDLVATASSTHREVSEAVQAILDKAPRAERRREILEAIGELYIHLARIE